MKRQRATFDVLENLPALEEGVMPQKRFYRSRAHVNPLSANEGISHPTSPEAVDWEAHFPGLPAERREVTMLDIGCGFGGLTVALAPLCPEETILAMEIRAKVTEFVRLRLLALRKEDAAGVRFQNASVVRCNSMRALPNFFPRGRMRALFFCFPDPHFKAKNHRRRIVNEGLLDEYAYLLRPGGRLYAITDVEDLHQWHVAKCAAHPAFRAVPESAWAEDPLVPAVQEETEEGKKVARAGNAKYLCVYERLPDEEVVTPDYLALCRAAVSAKPSESA